MVYTLLGLFYIVGWIGLKLLMMFMNKADKTEMNELYKDFKPDKKDWE